MTMTDCYETKTGIGGGARCADASCPPTTRNPLSWWSQTNSNMEQVMPTIDTIMSAQVSKQLENGGGISSWCAATAPTLRANNGVPFMSNQDYFSEGFAGIVVQLRAAGRGEGGKRMPCGEEVS